MPDIGEVRRADELGKKGLAYAVWQECSACHSPRWVWLKRKGVVPELTLCRDCYMTHGLRPLRKGPRGNRNGNWKGGEWRTPDGYVLVPLYPDDFYGSMAGKNYIVPEHRLVMAKHLRRPLASWEKVHHKNGVKDDNRIENLELTTQSDHLSGHTNGYRAGYQKGLYDGRDSRIKALEARVTALEAENALLQAVNSTR